MINPYTRSNNKTLYQKDRKDMYKRKYSDKDLFKGTQVEFEHTNDKRVAREIARTHLKENPDYYKYYNPQSKGNEFLIN